MRPALILSLFLGAVMAVDDVSRAPHAVQARAGPGAGHALLHEAFVYKREGKGKKSQPKQPSPKPGQRPDPPRFPGGGRS
ncbi:hypothetical protein CGCF415_v006242 [Colletotrichum fructicola]|uniref:Uncharacterized protein n=1 Tax=Colletotrichum fructicola (strain Nara gc5) TaxID=1213859 RepID=L2G2X4_COLFN|nr:uncharacterized protein CGMCC3_g15511 [Colletotrichum fructicola]KAF4482347.1 hypothetical protein CGGC5_v009884 [Colletotrichum fructicola Nara gc5]KAI8276175.1 hypothetical protein K4K60_008043 [Colletotrichum sp. SAR11_57]KAE9568360.1 hypothetical protein CGMCC3_g15511 [Colletotrichum fructicola]KAF4430672.1 hypothetical protein CFRS1_v009432 [Colletotrichum fructicola]KAF4884385.1 hypothetical protein CGCFRS4_v012774 [Colletotrichum fructicola]